MRRQLAGHAIASNKHALSASIEKQVLICDCSQVALQYTICKSPTKSLTKQLVASTYLSIFEELSIHQRYCNPEANIDAELFYFVRMDLEEARRRAHCEDGSRVVKHKQWRCGRWEVREVWVRCVRTDRHLGLRLGMRQRRHADWWEGI